jgi:hypothetical protein
MPLSIECDAARVRSGEGEQTSACRPRGSRCWTRSALEKAGCARATSSAPSSGAPEIASTTCFTGWCIC